MWINGFEMSTACAHSLVQDPPSLLYTAKKYDRSLATVQGMFDRYFVGRLKSIADIIFCSYACNHCPELRHTRTMPMNNSQNQASPSHQIQNATAQPHHRKSVRHTPIYVPRIKIVTSSPKLFFKPPHFYDWLWLEGLLPPFSYRSYGLGGKRMF
jgi:hypothetical protein